MYSEDISEKALSDQKYGIKINGIAVNNFKYADDTMLITKSHLQTLINFFVEVSKVA